ncbi:hypothetical protein ACFE04_007910 [Oxalis oulophora]
MGSRIDELEHSITDLKAEMGAEGSPSPSVPAKLKEETKAGGVPHVFTIQYKDIDTLKQQAKPNQVVTPSNTSKMGTSALILLLSILAIHVATSSSSTIDFDQLSLFPIKSECRGTIAECLMSDDDGGLDTEFAMDSEINRRILYGKKYISYGALKRNSVPCSRRGASYYNCRPGAQANPYSRGCSRITRCRR